MRTLHSSRPPTPTNSPTCNAQLPLRPVVVPFGSRMSWVRIRPSRLGGRTREVRADREVRREIAVPPHRHHEPERLLAPSLTGRSLGSSPRKNAASAADEPAPNVRPQRCHRSLCGAAGASVARRFTERRDDDRYTGLFRVLPTNWRRSSRSFTRSATASGCPGG